MTWSRRQFLKWAGLAGGVAVGGLGLHAARAGVPKYLRPPGAGTERHLLSACVRCGKCVEACPTDVLHLAPATAGVALGTPYLVARETPCDLCQGRDRMECIAVCPTEALEPVAARDEVRMGVAVIDPETCLPWLGVSCRSCWHACPFRDKAIVLDELGWPTIVEDACVGCGLCEYVCVTDPTSIPVVPQSALAEPEGSDR